MHDDLHLMHIPRHLDLAAKCACCMYWYENTEHTERGL